MRLVHLISGVFSDLAAGALTADKVAGRLEGLRLPTPSPAQICRAIMIANMIGPMVAPMMGYPWIPIPVPSYCTTAESLSPDQDRAIIHAVCMGLTA